MKSNPGVATLINPQYVASVKHNGGYKNVSFGDGENRYNIVDRNEHGSQDFHAPRLDKLVTKLYLRLLLKKGKKQMPTLIQNVTLRFIGQEVVRNISKIKVGM